MGLGMGFAMANQMMRGMGGAALGGGPAAGPAGGPPPVPSGPAYHVAVGGQSQGPFPVDQVIAGIGQGTIKPDTLVWSPGMAQWARAADVPQLASAFGTPPPPLPSGS
jgi:hypothetical protein